MDDEPHDAILEEIRERSGPIGDHLAALATSRDLPVLALGVCTIRIEESGPPLRALLDRAAAGEDLDESESQLLFCGLHILGARRDEGACAPLLRLLRRPSDEVERLLGDSITQTLPKIVAGAFDGDAEALFATIADACVDQFVRDALLRAAAFLAWEGRIDAGRMRAFLELFFERRLAEDCDFAWHGWQQAIALLGLRELRPLVVQAFAEQRIDEQWVELEDFDADLAEAERAPGDIDHFERAQLGYIEDVLVELEQFSWGEDSDSGAAADDFEELDDFEDPDGGWAEPAVNRWRNVGRNDPCPCGSGRKFKKCCLGKADLDANAD